ncbi:hypothetical protein BRAO375_4190005 [Bradyrhizobium sp. ORS 375]|nr:hypothetical protein BRAO375_4190005 [Bradyrhizobium sp. ORS 375]
MIAAPAPQISKRLKRINAENLRQIVTMVVEIGPLQPPAPCRRPKGRAMVAGQQERRFGSGR